MNSFESLENMMIKLNGTEGHNKVLEAIVRNKDTSGDFTAGKLEITYRELANKANVSLGTVTRAFVHWEHAGVIAVQPGLNRRHPNTIRYLGPPMINKEHPLYLIKKDFDELSETVNKLYLGMNLMENKLNFMLKQEQKNDFSAFRKAKPEKNRGYRW